MNDEEFERLVSNGLRPDYFERLIAEARRAREAEKKGFSAWVKGELDAAVERAKKAESDLATERAINELHESVIESLKADLAAARESLGAANDNAEKWRKAGIKAGEQIAALKALLQRALLDLDSHAVNVDVLEDEIKEALK